MSKKQFLHGTSRKKPDCPVYRQGRNLLFHPHKNTKIMSINQKLDEYKYAKFFPSFESDENNSCVFL